MLSGAARLCISISDNDKDDLSSNIVCTGEQPFQTLQRYKNNSINPIWGYCDGAEKGN